MYPQCMHKASRPAIIKPSPNDFAPCRPSMPAHWWPISCGVSVLSIWQIGKLIVKVIFVYPFVTFANINSEPSEIAFL